MVNSLKFFVLIGFTIFVNVCYTYAQTFIVTGRVLNDSTGEPLVKASVFATNTSLGTTTDNNGNFELALPANGGYTIVASFSGYNASEVRVSASDKNMEPIIFKLKPKANDLDVVLIVASNEVPNGFEKYGDFFYNEFLGSSPFAKQTKLANPEQLKFYYSKKKNKLKVLANEPIEMINQALGYHISYVLDSFVYDYNTQTTFYSGNPLYTNLETTDTSFINTWKQNRLQAYYGSLLHFMRSIYQKKLQQEKFVLKTIDTLSGKPTANVIKNPYAFLDWLIDSSTQIVEVLPKTSLVGVAYTGAKPNTAYSDENPAEPKNFQFSLIEFKPEEPIAIEANGYYFDQDDLLFNRYLGWLKMGDMLPFDFDVEHPYPTNTTSSTTP